MSAEPVASQRVSARQAASRREILDAAWAIAREEGLSAITMRDLGARVGMRAQSLYGYYPAKNAIYDAMFADAQERLLARIDALHKDRDPVAALRRLNRAWLTFCTEEPVRYQLLYQRTLPGFEPSAQSYELAVRALEHSRICLRRCGITSARAVDAWTAVTTGLAAQQTANDPDGNRWLKLADEITEMYLAHFGPKPTPT